ncbi:MAG: alpha/beta hydrolase [Solirubrobacteraceae bacterium MAG38_C4-C5]|nr:alpha/beta hydrolase [Candidatus Siliceabacter maunaloa]
MRSTIALRYNRVVIGVVEGAGVALAYEEAGPPDGPAVVLVHDMAADARTWAPVAQALAGRVIAYDRRGYGGSGAPEPYRATTVSEQAEDLAALVAGLGAAPALLAGEGLGALAVLDVLRRHPAAARGGLLIDPPLFAFVPEATQELSARRAELEGAVRAGGPGEAVARWLGAAADPGCVERARGDARAFFADLGGLATLSLTRAELRAIAAPVVVLTGPGTAPAVRLAADRVVDLLAAGTRADDGDVVAVLSALAAH